MVYLSGHLSYSFSIFPFAVLFREMTLFEAVSFRRFCRRKAVRPSERSAVVKNTQTDLSRLVRTADRVVRKVNSCRRSANRSYPHLLLNRHSM